MSTIFICDGCGRKSEQRFSTFEPHDWYERIKREAGKETYYHACSRPCIEMVAKKYGGTAVVLPI